MEAEIVSQLESISHGIWGLIGVLAAMTFVIGSLR